MFVVRTDRTLTEFLTYVLQMVPRIQRFESPLLHYLPKEQLLFYPKKKGPVVSALGGEFIPEEYRKDKNA